MPTVSGFLKVAHTGNKFTASFIIEDIMFTAAGAFTPSVPHFDSQPITLTYDNIIQITAIREFTGTVGVADVKIRFANGPALNGPIDPAVDPPVQVVGRVNWGQI